MKHLNQFAIESLQLGNRLLNLLNVLVEEGSDRILGAHILGHHVEELVNLFAMAIRFKLRPEDLKKMIFAYPTAASDIGYIVEDKQ
ncbi:hypothetical protein NIES1031_22500 [Chroogloeocystis siderophila 5.2 s.c.1]|uniref:Pyridine nucleotide-disulphide oxidoreductase dimerisation domain-containing protein n=1 Tax=Chroogloeocystis siderophila 5.2 s.c.1 TaxID=247279 RepID=A0A1U7HBK8_9CHRO|nr:hypothetical protein NIES1031_22500 [Chroogloeocystis siderophila 5.2 s.c.1]